MAATVPPFFFFRPKHDFYSWWGRLITNAAMCKSLMIKHSVCFLLVWSAPFAWVADVPRGALAIFFFTKSKKMCLIPCIHDFLCYSSPDFWFRHFCRFRVCQSLELKRRHAGLRPSRRVVPRTFPPTTAWECGLYPARYGNFFPSSGRFFSQLKHILPL